MKLLQSPAWDSPTRMILLIALCLRIGVAFSTLDILHPDQHYQTLEPASHAVLGWGWMAWEWSAGLRSWFTPGIYAAVIGLCKVFGLVGGPVPIYLCRTLTAVFSTGAVASVAYILTRRGISDLARWVTVAVFAVWPTFLIWAPATLSDTLAQDFLWIALAVVVWASSQNVRLPWLLAGFAMGWTFPVRIQMLVWSGSVFVSMLVLVPAARRFWIWALAGFLVPVIFQGALDWATWGRPFHSVIVNIQKNGLENVASFYGVSPWYDYFPRVMGDLGLGFFISVGVCVVLAFSLGWRLLCRMDAWMTLPGILFVAVHSMIPHKETRFLLPFYPLTIYWMGLGLNSVLTSWKTTERKQWGAVFLTALLAVPASYYATRPDSYPNSNMSRLMIRVWSDGKLQAGDCILSVGHNWVWTHGELLQGKPYRFPEANLQTLTDAQLRECPYAIVLPQWETEFAKHAASVSASWHPIQREYWGYVLYTR